MTEEVRGIAPCARAMAPRAAEEAVEALRRDGTFDKLKKQLLAGVEARRGGDGGIDAMTHDDITRSQALHAVLDGSAARAGTGAAERRAAAASLGTARARGKATRAGASRARSVASCAPKRCMRSSWRALETRPRRRCASRGPGIVFSALGPPSEGSESCWRSLANAAARASCQCRPSPPPPAYGRGRLVSHLKRCVFGSPGPRLTRSAAPHASRLLPLSRGAGEARLDASGGRGVGHAGAGWGVGESGSGCGREGRGGRGQRGRFASNQATKGLRVRGDGWRALLHNRSRR